jgi:hypothetical protein
VRILPAGFARQVVGGSGKRFRRVD